MTSSPIRGPVLQAHEWRDATFLHWRYDAADVQAQLPDGLTVETHDGVAWVSLVLLRMRVGVPFTRLLRPHLRVLEANLRTYVTGPDGEAGIYFLSIDCDRWPVSVGGRAIGVRYLMATQGMTRHGRALTYRGSRYGRNASYDVSVTVGDELPTGELDAWLVERYSVYGALGPALVQVPASHSPWPLRDITVDHLRESLLSAAGLPEPKSDPLAHYSRGVTDVVFGLPTVFTR